jgi:hypothetical protein
MVNVIYHIIVMDALMIVLSELKTIINYEKNTNNGRISQRKIIYNS